MVAVYTSFLCVFWMMYAFYWRNVLAYVFEVYINSLFDNVSGEVAFGSVQIKI